jgi:ABC-type sugar transport system ATPase subunit
MISVQNLHITQGRFSLADISFHIPEGAYAVLTGKSGSGKTSLLEAICGLRPIQRGQIVLGDIDVTTMRPAERRIG